VPFTLRPQETIVDPVTRVGKVHHLHDYVCLIHDGGKYFIQHGEVYAGPGGSPLPVTDLPDAFWDQYRNLTSQQRRIVELELPGDKVSSLEDLPPELIAQIRSLPDEVRAQLIGHPVHARPAEARSVEPLAPEPTVGFIEEEDEEEETPEPFQKPSFWQCPECSADVPLTHKGLHIGQHRRAEKAAARRKAQT
jgi:hypothetical protein